MEVRWRSVEGPILHGPRRGFPPTRGVRKPGAGADNPLMAVVKGGMPGGGYVGRFGNAIFYESEGRTIMRSAGEVSNPRTPEQQAGRRQFGGVARTWGDLDDGAYAAWEGFGAATGTTGYRAFVALRRGWLRTNPDGAPPEMPPTEAFLGDAARLRLGPSEGVGEASAPPAAPGRMTPAPTDVREATPEDYARRGLPLPPDMDPPGEEGSGVLVVADRANGAGVVTEVRAQRIAGPRRKPKKRDWKSMGFFAFTDDVRAATVALPKGCWSLEYRFWDRTSGRVTASAALGAATVG